MEVLPDGARLSFGGGGRARQCSSFRSDLGSRLAVETAVQVGLEFLEGVGNAMPSAVKLAAEQRLPHGSSRIGSGGSDQHGQRIRLRRLS